jgi:hypothetical protein
MRPMVPPATGEDDSRSPGATLTEDEIIEKLERGEIRRSELSNDQLERLGLKPAEK